MIPLTEESSSQGMGCLVPSQVIVSPPETQKGNTCTETFEDLFAEMVEIIGIIQHPPDLDLVQKPYLNSPKVHNEESTVETQPILQNAGIVDLGPYPNEQGIIYMERTDQETAVPLQGFPEGQLFRFAKLPNGPLTKVPIGVERYRSITNQQKWGLRLHKETGFVTHVGD